MSKYLGSFDSFESVVANFEGVYISKAEYEAKESPYPNVKAWEERKAELKKYLEHEDYKDIEILWAKYEEGNYCGYAFVLFRKDGQMYRVDGSHCSCYGLEGQWTPEAVTLKALKEVQKSRTTHEYPPSKEFAEFLETLEE